ncbi:MAG: tectonin domain-containing protein [Pseudomonadota bacterium]|nr:tectonin domain-containing protein [Pseudomonadota bacterium]
MLGAAIRKLTLLIALCFVLAGTNSPSYAQITVNHPTVNQWEKIQGAAIDIAISKDGAVAALESNGDVYRYIHSDARWQRIGQDMIRIGGGDGDSLWGIDKHKRLRRFTGTQWEAIGSGAEDFVIDGDGNAYVATNTKTLAFYAAKTSKWSSLDGTAKKITIDDKGLIWVVLSDGSIARRLDDAWIGLNEQAVDIAADASGRVFALKSDKKLYQWNEDKSQFEVFYTAQNVQSFAVQKQQIWITTDRNQIFAQGHKNIQQREQDGLVTKPGGGGSTDPAEVIDDSPIIFELVSNSERLEDLAIGRDGSVFGLTTSGNIRRWSNGEGRFYDFPGTLERLAIQSSGLPVGIGSNDNLLEHDEEAWRQVNLAEELIDLTLYGDGRILAVNNDERVIRLSELRTTFTLLGTRAQQIAATKQGAYWVVDNVDRLFFCDESASCQQKNIQASDISVGPAGSVFIVDKNAALRRYNAAEDVFDIIAQDQQVSRVALGPGDRPWIINTDGKIYASRYFERDETKDRILATKTEATEEVTTEQPNVSGNNGGVQIVQSISFDQVTIPTTASGIGSIGSGLIDITAGADDIVIASGYDSFCKNGTGRNWVYNSLSRSFSHLDYLQRMNVTVGLAVDELVKADVNGTTPPTSPSPVIPSLILEWNENCTDQSVLTTYVGSVFTDPAVQSSQDFSAATFSSPLDDSQTPDLDYSADGYVFNIAPNDELEFFKPETANDVSFFDSIDFMRVGVGKTREDIWAVSTTYNVYEFVPSTDSFELRSVSADDKAQDIGVGQDGSVFIVNTSGVLKKWDETAKRFVKTNKTGVTRVAVDSRGNPIVANFPDSQIVYFGR